MNAGNLLCSTNIGAIILRCGKLTPDLLDGDLLMQKNKKRWIILGIVLIVSVAGVLFLANWRTIGKQMANPLRDLLGVEIVANIETAIFVVQDQIEQWKFDLGLAQAANPFGEVSDSDVVVSIPTSALPTQTLLSTDAALPQSITPSPTDSQIDTQATQVPTETIPTATIEPTPTPSAARCHALNGGGSVATPRTAGWSSSS